MDSRSLRSRVPLAAALVGVLATGVPALASLEGSSRPTGAVPAIEVLSNRADLLSGGDALVEVTVPRGKRLSSVRVLAGRRDVTSSFRPAGVTTLRGLVTGLPLGKTILTARVRGGRGAQLPVTNHRLSGPVFSGPQHKTWFCATEAQGLGPSTLPTCSAPTKVEYFYRTTAGAWAAYNKDAGTPPDLATTTTDQGKTVPFVVRQEVGTLNRGLYAIASLWDFQAKTPSWLAQGPWSHKLIYSAGSGVGVKPHQGYVGVIKAGFEPRSSNSNGGTDYPAMLGKGFSIAANSLTIGDVNNNGVLAAESMMMTKERAIELLGPIRYTIGSGGSGGSMTQNNISAAYPGLLDALVLGANFLEVYTNSALGIDLESLHDYYYSADAVSQGLTPLQERRIEGDLEPSGSTIQEFLHWHNPEACDDEPWRYEDVTRPGGFRCTLQDHQVNVFGPRPKSVWSAVEKKLGRGFAARPLDNVGIQYGLNVLKSGEITPAQFIDLNAKIMGRDIDMRPTPQRTVADSQALTAAYRAGRIPTGENWGDIPILDLGGDGNIAIHLDVRGIQMRERVRRAHGNTANYVRWKFDGYSTGLQTPETSELALGLIDRWLAGIEKDDRNLSKRQKMLANKPKDAVDRCYVYYQPVSEDASTCNTVYPVSKTPRQVAGGPISEDVAKCHLKPLKLSDYAGAVPAMTPAQFEQLKKVFPTGVCDYSKRSVGWTRVVNWLSFADGPGGKPLGPPPIAQPL